MPNKAKTDRRLADQLRVVSMMPVGQPVSCMELIAKMGDLSPNSIGAFLRNAYKNGFVEKAGTRCAPVKSHHQMVTLWVRLKTAKEPPVVPWFDSEDQQWMAYWKARRQQHQLKIKHWKKKYVPLSATPL